MMFSMIPRQSWLMESFLIEFSAIYMVGKRWKPEPPEKNLQEVAAIDEVMCHPAFEHPIPMAVSGVWRLLARIPAFNDMLTGR